MTEYMVGNGKVFVDFDSHSGGYPYASKGSGATTTSLKEAIEEFLPAAKSQYANIPNPKVYKIVLEEVNIENYQENKTKSFVDDLTPEQKESLKKLLFKA